MISPCVALASPSIRTVVVCGSIMGDPEDPDFPDFEHDVLDVLAIRSTTEPDREWFEARNDLLVWFPDVKILATQDDLDSQYPAWQLVVCPWPRDEDEKRLEETVKAVRYETLRKVRKSAGATP